MACVRVGAASAQSPSSRRMSPYARSRPLNSSSAANSSSSSPGRKRMPKSLSVDLSYIARVAESDSMNADTSHMPLTPRHPDSAPGRLLATYPSSTASSPSPPDNPTAPPPPRSQTSASTAGLSSAYTLITPHLAIADIEFAEDAVQLRQAGITHVVSVVGERVHVPAHIPPAHHLHVTLADAPFAELVGALGPVVSWVSGVLRAAGVVPQSPRIDDETRSAEAETHPEKNVRILVHCALGISRSPAVAAALLVALPLVAMDASEDPDVGMAAMGMERGAADADANSDSAIMGPNRNLGSRRAPRRALSAPAALAYIAARRPAADPNWGFRVQLDEWERMCRARELGTGGT